MRYYSVNVHYADQCTFFELATEHELTSRSDAIAAIRHYAEQHGNSGKRFEIVSHEMFEV